MDLEIETPAWAEQLLRPARYKGIWGGRGGGKSHERAEAMIERHLMDTSTSSVCLREVQKSIKMSVKRLLEIKIESMGVGDQFIVQDAQIKNKYGAGIIIFQGMQNHTADSIKSLEGFDIAWFEEAQSMSQRSLDLLRPTIRKTNSELWFTWNPNKQTDPVDVFFRCENPHPGAVVVKVNYMDNKRLPSVLKEEMEYDKARDVDKYRHVWLGEYLQRTNSRVFQNWAVEEFDTPPDAMLRFGADWGFAVDPTVLVRCYLVGRKLYIDYEAYQVGCDIVDTPDLFMTVPESERWPIIADSSRPETIAHLRKHGFSKIMGAAKGPGSVEDGIEFLKSYDIVVHPRCERAIDELMHYSYKVDPETDKVLSVIEDKNNHVIDALRYACEGTRRLRNTRQQVVAPIPVVNYW